MALQHFKEDPDQITIDKNEHLLSDKVHAIILEVIKEHIYKLYFTK